MHLDVIFEVFVSRCSCLRTRIHWVVARKEADAVLEGEDHFQDVIWDPALEKWGSSVRKEKLELCSFISSPICDGSHFAREFPRNAFRPEFGQLLHDLQVGS